MIDLILSSDAAMNTVIEINLAPVSNIVDMIFFCEIEVTI